MDNKQRSHFRRAKSLGNPLDYHRPDTYKLQPLSEMRGDYVLTADSWFCYVYDLHGDYYRSWYKYTLRGLSRDETLPAFELVYHEKAEVYEPDEEDSYDDDDEDGKDTSYYDTSRYKESGTRENPYSLSNIPDRPDLDLGVCVRYSMGSTRLVHTLSDLIALSQFVSANEQYIDVLYTPLGITPRTAQSVLATANLSKVNISDLTSAIRKEKFRSPSEKTQQ